MDTQPAHTQEHDSELNDAELEAAAGGTIIGTIVMGPLAGAVADAAKASTEAE
tara:strand:- start:13 stop:171 length:159 start_codon:yes stop_codon:yes gene_type:complete